MKQLFCKLLLALIATAALAGFELRAQTPGVLEDKSYPVGEFGVVNITDGFDVTLQKGAYGVKTTTDKLLSPYVQVYVRARTLYITYDNKAVPKDVKAAFKGKNAPTPIFRVVIYLPEITGLNLSENVVLHTAESFTGDKVEINLADKAQISNMNLSVKSLAINAKKNAQAFMAVQAEGDVAISTDGSADVKSSVKAKEVSLSSQGSSKVTLTAEAEAFQFNAAGSSEASVNATAPKCEITMAGSSKLTLSGQTEELELKGERSAELKGNDFEAKKVTLSLAGGADATVKVSEKLDATLVGGSEFYFIGTPEIKIGKIIKSTLAPFGTPAK